MAYILHVVSCTLLVSLAGGAGGVPARHAPSRFTSHVSVSTPARSYSHGVGDVLPAPAPHPPAAPRRFPRVELHGNLRSLRVLPYPGFRNPYGYPKERPTVPFYQEDIPLGNSLLQSPWPADFLKIGTIPVLPASPYRVNSANPESLWPEGLFIPPSVPLRGFGVSNVHRLAAKSDNFIHTSDNEIHDPFLLGDEEALQALEDIKRHGELFFHDIPHEQSLLDNQQLRIDNGLEPHRLGSIRHSWTYYRP